MGRVTLQIVSAAMVAIAAATLALTGCGGTPDETTPPKRSPAATRDHTYHGVGSRLIGPLTLRRGADVSWTSTRGLFMLIAVNAPASAQLVVSNALRGTQYVPGGSYVLKVGTLPGSRWTLKFHER